MPVFVNTMGWGNIGNTEDVPPACDDLGHLPSKDIPNYCLDCKQTIDESEDVGKQKKPKSSKKATVTKGPPAAKKPEPVVPREYKPLAEFKDFIPVAPPPSVRPKDPVGNKGSGSSVSSSYTSDSFDDYMGWF